MLWNPGADYIYASWQDGGTERSIVSQQFDDGSSHSDLNQWLTIDIAIDLSTGTTAGSQLWVDKISRDTTWSGAIDAKSSEFAKLDIGHSAGGSNGQCEYAYIMLVPDYVASNADVQNDYADVKHEMIVWDFNGEGIGRTRVNVTSDVLRYTRTAKVEEPMNGAAGANTIDFSLDSTDGSYNDDVYATWNPSGTAAGRYNGTNAQKYLQTRMRVETESWYDGDRELVFVGRVDNNLLRRSSQVGAATVVQVTAEDAAADIALSLKGEGEAWENYQLADTDESNSLLHAIARIGTQPHIRNYVTDSGFEHATITTAWTAAGAGFVVTRDTTNEFVGTACAELDATGGAGNISQEVTFTGVKQLQVDETYTFSVYVQCATAATVTIDLEEHDGSGQNAETTNSLVIAATQDYYDRVDVTHTITDADSDRLVCRINVSNGDVVYADACMLTESDRAYDWCVDNTATSKSADDYADGSYDTVGFDVEPLLTLTDETGAIDTTIFTHPWAIIEPDSSPWKLINQLADAGIATYVGLDAAGCFRGRFVFGGWGDPTNSGTIDQSMVTGVATSMRRILANQIIIRGVKIVKASDDLYIWGITAAQVLDTAGGEAIEETIANGATWPPSDEFGRFFADFRDEDFGQPGRQVSIDEVGVVGPVFTG